MTDESIEDLEFEFTPVKRKSKAKQRFGNLTEPLLTPATSTPDRNEWIKNVVAAFVSPTESNRTYYRVILEALYPEGHGIPGPHITRQQIREAIDNYRRSKHKGNKPYKSYVDAFRRVRELQGEEGLTGIISVGHTYQLISLELSDKRIPRTHLSDENWLVVLEAYNYSCASCRRSEPEVRLQQDHKIPRLRADKIVFLDGGIDTLSNWQPLCDECNIFKSTSCRACTLDCFICPWAYPEKYAPIRLSLELIAELRAFASRTDINVNELTNELIRQFLSKQTKS